MDETKLLDNRTDSLESESILGAAEAPTEEHAVCELGEEADALSPESAPDAAEGEAGKDTAESERAPKQRKKRRARRAEQYIYTPRDRLICVIASGVAAAAALVLVYLLAAALGDMSAAMQGLGDSAVIERLIGAFAHLLIVFGFGTGAVALVAIAYAFAKRAHKGAEGKWRVPALVMRIIPAPILLAAVAMMASAVIIAL